MFIFRSIFFIRSKAAHSEPLLLLPVDLLTSSVIPSGLQQEGNTKIRIEPGLFEWTKWVSGTALPTWIPPAELAAAKLSVDTTYRYVQTHALSLPHTLARFIFRVRSCPP